MCLLLTLKACWERTHREPAIAVDMLQWSIAIEHVSRLAAKYDQSQFGSYNLGDT